MVPQVSVIICTYNPRPDIFARVLDAIDRQTMPKDQFELIVVDNNSPSPLDENEINRGRGFNAKVIREPRQGNVFARQTAVKAAHTDLIIFIDDDNIPDANYFEVGLQIMRDHPQIGACGGLARGELEGSKIWAGSLLPFLGVRDYGPDVLTSFEDRWGKWEPIGAGMVFRKNVGMKYVEMVQEILVSHSLGRKGNGLLAGEDSLLARATYKLKMACSYQPSLKITHVIKKERLSFDYLRRLMLGHGRSTVILERALGTQVRPMAISMLLLTLVYRIGRNGFRGALWWCWYLGYFLESRKKPRAGDAPTHQQPV